MNKQDMIAYEAWGALEHFSTRPECPQWMRELVKEYAQRMEDARLAEKIMRVGENHDA